MSLGPRTRRRAGRAIGLLGGSFNPPHEGHRHVSLLALQRLNLSEVWWLVSPGNPLKDRSELAAYEARCAAARVVARHPRIRISSFERDRGLVYTAETLQALRAQARDDAFVWIMGADNLATIHRWNHWADIFHTVPLAVLDRPGYRFKAMASPAAIRFAGARIDERDAPRLCRMAPPAWCFLAGPLNPLSSTALRHRNGHAQQDDT